MSTETLKRWLATTTIVCGLRTTLNWRNSLTVPDEGLKQHFMHVLKNVILPWPGNNKQVYTWAFLFRNMLYNTTLSHCVFWQSPEINPFFALHYNCSQKKSGSFYCKLNGNRSVKGLCVVASFCAIPFPRLLECIQADFRVSTYNYENVPTNCHLYQS